MQPHSDWDDLDFELLEALDVMERDLSTTTGLPRWLTMSAYPGVGFEVDTTQDGAEEALDRWDEGNAGKKRRPGVHRFAVPVSLDGEPLEGGLARERMLRYAAEQAEKREDADAEEGVEIERVRPPGGYDASQYG